MDHALYVAWRAGDSSHGRWGPVGRLEHDGDGYRFVYTRGARMLEGFHAFPGMPDLDGVYESEDLFPFFANRLLARSRPEYKSYLLWGGFDPRDPPDPIALLGVTEGRRATDSYELFPRPSPDAEGQYVSKFFLHGARWASEKGRGRIGTLSQGERLNVRPQPDNQHDANAVGVWAATEADDVRIGYVPRYLARDAGDLLHAYGQDAVALTVERRNKDAPWQQRVLCRLRACWPASFDPCSRDEYQPIVDVLSSV